MPFIGGYSGPATRWAGRSASIVPSARWNREPSIGKPWAMTSLRQAERVQGAQRVARLDDPDAVDGPLRVDLGDVDLDAGTPQRERRGQAADAAAHDEDPAD